MIESDDTLEIIKIVISLIIGYILIKELFGTEVVTKCICDCKDAIHLG